MPVNFEIYKILDYLYNNLGVKEHILDSNRDNQEATDHLSLGLKLSKGRGAEHIILDNRLELSQAYNYIYFLFDEEAQDERKKHPSKQASMHLVFFKKKNFETPIN